MRVNANRDAKGACQSEIGQLDCSVLVDEQVLWLQVSVEHSSLVTEKHSLEEKKPVLSSIS